VSVPVGRRWGRGEREGRRGSDPVVGKHNALSVRSTPRSHATFILGESSETIPEREKREGRGGKRREGGREGRKREEGREEEGGREEEKGRGGVRMN
jgi:hypothetical protein